MTESVTVAHGVTELTEGAKLNEPEEPLELAYIVNETIGM